MGSISRCCRTLFSLFAVLSIVSGCGIGTPDNTPQVGSLSNLRGVVHGGQAPIANPHVYVFATGSTAYAGPGIAAGSSNAATSLLTSAVATNNPGHYGQDVNGNYYVIGDANGEWSLNGDYSCTLGTQVYVYSQGGSAGQGSNSAIGLLSALGACPAGGNFSSISFITVNEVSTIGTAYAMAGFATDATHVSNSGTTLGNQGLANAFATAQMLYDLGSGTALATTTQGTGTPPQQTVNTLANILAACVDSAGSTSFECSKVFTDTGVSNTLDMATVAIKWAQAPAVNGNVGDLYGLQTGTSPFPTDLTATPNDFTLAIGFTDPSFLYASAIAIDAANNVWALGGGTGTISEFNGSTGQILSGANGYSDPNAVLPETLAIDGSGNAWVTNAYGGTDGNGALSEFNGATGAVMSGTNGYSGGGLSGPTGIAIDGGGHVWVANGYTGETQGLSKFDSNGNPLSGSGYNGGGLGPAYSIAVDASGYVWLPSGYSSNSTLSKFNPTTSTFVIDAGYTGGGMDYPYSIAIGSSGNVWISNDDSTGILSEFNGSTGAAISSSGYTGGGSSFSGGMAVDGAGNVWIANIAYFTFPNVSEFNSSGTALSGTTGYTASGSIASPNGIAVDGSGNVWVGDPGQNFTYAVTEIVGAAVPVATPLQYQVANNVIGQRP